MSGLGARLRSRVERVFREDNEPAGGEPRLSRDEAFETLYEAGQAWLVLLDEHEKLVAAFREVQRKYVRTDRA